MQSLVSDFFPPPRRLMTWDQLPDSRQHVLDDKVWNCLCYDLDLLCLGTLTLFIKKIAINLENYPSWVGGCNIIASRLFYGYLIKYYHWFIKYFFWVPDIFKLYVFIKYSELKKFDFPQESFYVFELLSICLFCFCCFKFSSIEWIGWGIIN